MKTAIAYTVDVLDHNGDSRSRRRLDSRREVEKVVSQIRRLKKSGNAEWVGRVMIYVHKSTTATLCAARFKSGPNPDQSLSIAKDGKTGVITFSKKKGCAVFTMTMPGKKPLIVSANQFMFNDMNELVGYMVPVLSAAGFTVDKNDSR